MRATAPFPDSSPMGETPSSPPHSTAFGASILAPIRRSTLALPFTYPASATAGRPNAGCIGVASWSTPALGNVPPRLPFIFLVSSEPHKLWVSSLALYVVAYPDKKYTGLLSLFIARTDVTMKLFSLSFVPLVARNSGDAIAWRHASAWVDHYIGLAVDRPTKCSLGN